MTKRETEAVRCKGNLVVVVLQLMRWAVGSRWPIGTVCAHPLREETGSGERDSILSSRAALLCRLPAHTGGCRRDWKNRSGGCAYHGEAGRCLGAAAGAVGVAALLLRCRDCRVFVVEGQGEEAL